MERTKAVGVHVFAGGFTQGVQDVMDVKAQLEIHNFGRETAVQLGVDFHNCSQWEEWLEHSDAYKGVKLVYGNPRCTGFSCVTAGYGKDSHGPWSKQTADVYDLCRFGVKIDAPFICWESVQQAFTVGRPLLNWLRDELFKPNGYRIAHLMINAATFGNAQRRRRYFFMAYKADYRFNIEAPPLPEKQSLTGDILKPFMGLDATSHNWRTDDYGPESYTWWGEDVAPLIPHFNEGWDLHEFAAQKGAVLEQLSPKLWNTWITRISNLPFSMHCASRPRWNKPSPVIFSAATAWIHPRLHRGYTIRELAAIMGWKPDVFPKGPMPIPQIAKGVVPAVGTWLAEQVEHSINKRWSTDDWESSYDKHRGQWVGQTCQQAVEKTLNMTHYTVHHVD